MNTSKLSKLLIWRFHLFTQCIPTLHPTWQFNNWRGTTPGRHQTWFVTSMTRRASHGAIYARHMKSCQLWGLATSAHSKDKKISMEETKRNQKKPVSLDWLRENLQETHGVLPWNIGFSCEFSHHPILCLLRTSICGKVLRLALLWDNLHISRSTLSSSCLLLNLWAINSENIISCFVGLCYPGFV
jgi:hypothetical protein